MKIHKNAIIRNRPSEKLSPGCRRATRCGALLRSTLTRDSWRGVTCKNCLKTKRKARKCW